MRTTNTILAVAFLLSIASAGAQVLQIERTDGQILEMNIDDIKEMRFKEEQVYEGNVPENLQIVDLGLSVNWASLNIGAEAPEEIGYYIAWGETEDKDWYSWSYYKHVNSQSSLEKYNKSDGIEILQAEDDAATVIWGSEWRMPTQAEFQELIDNCTIDYGAEENGVSGVRLTSNVPGYEGKSIFLPAAGWIQDNMNNVNNGTLSTYWTASVVTFFPQFACAAEFWLSGDYAGTVQVSGTYRYLGRPIRAVTAK